MVVNNNNNGKNRWARLKGEQNWALRDQNLDSSRRTVFQRALGKAYRKGKTYLGRNLQGQQIGRKLSKGGISDH